MSEWRRSAYSWLLIGVVGLAVLVPGCGIAGGAGNTTGTNPEVKIEPPKDAQGRTYPITDDAMPAR